MRKILLTLLVFTTIQFIFGQNTTVKINPEYFIIGALDDYLGRYLTSESSNKVDNFADYEKSIVLKIDSLIKDNYVDLNILYSKKKGIEITSKQLSMKINKLYDFDYSTHQCRGKLKSDILKTEEEKLSFLTGAYVRFGGQKDSVYYIKLYNSTSKADKCSELLTEIGCSKVNYEIKRNIPAIHTVSFVPTKKLQKYLDNYNYLSTEIARAYIKKYNIDIRQTK